MGELFPRVGFIVTNSNLEAHNLVTIYNGRAEIENRIKEGKNTLRWDKTSCHRFAANQARLLVGCLAYNLLHMIRDTAFWGQSVRPSIDSIIRRIVKVGARVVYHARRWHVMLHRLFPSHANIESYSLEPVTRRCGGTGFTKCGEEVCPKSKKSPSFAFQLYSGLKRRMILPSVGSLRAFFPGGNQPQRAVGMCLH